MRVSKIAIPAPFKRFGSLDIDDLGAGVDLVVMLGPNGSGKSSVFDAMLEWARHRGRQRRQNVPSAYFSADTSSVGSPEIVFHEDGSTPPPEQPGSRLHVRTAHRNTPDVLTNAVQKAQKFGTTSRFDRMIETDTALAEHYQRLVASFLPVLANLDGPDAAGSLDEIRGRLAPVKEALTRILPHLQFTGLGDPTSDGSFYFARDGASEFRYENLSGGEKAVFDLLLDVHIAATELEDPLVCLDEPEIHLNPAVQAAVLRELLHLLPSGSQLWIATHSVGMIRRAFELAASEPDRVAFLDFGKVQGPAPEVVMRPVEPSRRLFEDALTVALDDLAGLLAPPVLVVCEGSQESDRVLAWDERIYRHIFRDLHQRVEFVSSGGKADLEHAAAIAAVVAPGTTLLKLRDRDDLTEDHRRRILEADPSLRVLMRRSLESYLLDDEVLERLVDERGMNSSDALDQLTKARDEAMKSNGSAKGSLGAVFDTARRVLKDTDGLGENKAQFSADVLARLILPSMEVAKELEVVLDLESPG
ncbi:MAG: AAA family ATPase [Actinomycetia bacterium]|nr:AAA family ATPase [Actinomycetes bacterium]